MKQKIHHGAELETLTPAEALALIRTFRAESEPRRVRAAATVKLDANGNGQDEVYTVPVGFEFEARRIVVDLDTASDPNTGSVPLGVASGTRPANINPQTSAANAFNGPSVAGVPGQRITLNEVVLFASAAGNATVIVTDGTTSLNFGTIAVGTAPTVLSVNETFGVGAGVQVQVGAAGVGVTSTVSASGTIAPPFTAGTAIEYLRSGTRVEYGQPTFGGAVQVPGSQTWGNEQGPYFRNGEVVEVKARGLTANATLDVTVEGIMRRPERPPGRAGVVS